MTLCGLEIYHQLPLLERQIVASRAPVLDHAEVFRRQPKGLQYPVAQLLQLPHDLTHFALLRFLHSRREIPQGLADCFAIRRGQSLQL